MTNAIDILRHLIDCYGWRDSRDMQDFIDAADMIDMQYVELTKDTDGERIHVGDMIKLPNCKSDEVRFMTINGAGWLINESGWLPCKVSHSKPDTWELMTKEYAYAYESGYRDGATNYELDHCPSCTNLVSLQEALDENAKLRELVRNLLVCDKHLACDDCPYRHEPCDFEYDARELGVEVDA